MREQLLKSISMPPHAKWQNHSEQSNSSGKPQLSPARPAASGSASPLPLRCGMNVMLNGFGDDKDIEDRARLEDEFDVGVAYSAADMSKPADIVAMIEDARKHVRPGRRARQQCRHPACGGDRDVSRRRSGTRSSPSTCRRHFMRIRAVVPEMKARKWGRIINIASAHGLVASPFKSAYVAAKHGVARPDQDGGAGDGRARHHGQCHLPRLRADTAGAEADPRDGQGARDQRRASHPNVLLHAQPTKQFVTTEQIGALAVFLCTGAAASITGTALPVEGGWTAQ